MGRSRAIYALLAACEVAALHAPRATAPSSARRAVAVPDLYAPPGATARPAGPADASDASGDATREGKSAVIFGFFAASPRELGFIEKQYARNGFTDVVVAPVPRGLSLGSTSASRWRRGDGATRGCQGGGSRRRRGHDGDILRRRVVRRDGGDAEISTARFGTRPLHAVPKETPPTGPVRHLARRAAERLVQGLSGQREARARAVTKLRGAFKVQLPCAQREAGMLLNISAKFWRISSPD